LLGIAWDLWKDAKTGILAGIALYYENVIFNNVLFDRPLRLPTGAFLQTAVPCVFGPVPNSIPGLPQLQPTAAECGTSSSLHYVAAGTAVATLQQQFQALSPFSLSAPNPAIYRHTSGAQI
jgi:hypothetical protein